MICVGGALGGAFGDVQNHSVRQLFIFLFLFLTGLIWVVFFVICIGDPPCETSQKKKKKNFLVHRQSTLGPPLLTTPKGRSAGVLVMSNGRGARVVVAFDFAPPPVGGIYVGRRHPGAVDLIILAPGSSNIWASPKLNLPS